MTTFRQKTYSEGVSQIFLSFLGALTGIINKTKNLHWAAPKKNIHVYLDEFHAIASNYQDAIAEGYMGILGQMEPGDVVCKACDSSDANSLIDYTIQVTKEFYEQIPGGTEFKGLTGETESFIQECNKYKYLFGLCDI